MERRHQVFVSSTYADLADERAEIIQALLELDCFPAGMEMFPATSATAWELIKGVIDDSDYYCLVSAGRYGTVDEGGVSFTEKEYDYALEKKKPIMVFLHKNPGGIPADKCEKSEAGKASLAAFKDKVQAAHHCKYWSSADELGGQVSRSLVLMKKSNPSDGWVPGRYAADESMLVENANLKAKVSQLEAELVVSKVGLKRSPAENLAGTTDIYDAHVSFKLDPKGDYLTHVIKVSWDQILRYVGPTLVGECTDEELVEKLHLCFYHLIKARPGWENCLSNGVIAPYIVRDEIKVQLRALGYMVPGTKRRAVADQKVYWKLTDEGDARLIQIQAIKKPLPPLPPLPAAPLENAIAVPPPAQH